MASPRARLPERPARSPRRLPVLRRDRPRRSTRASRSVGERRFPVLRHRRRPPPIDDGVPRRAAPARVERDMSEVAVRSGCPCGGHLPCQFCSCASDDGARCFMSALAITRATVLAASIGDSCDQNRSALQPLAWSRAFVSASRSPLASIFRRQKPAFRFGYVACSGQPCQKQPSTKTAILRPGKATSATRRGFLRTSYPILYRTPIPYISPPH